MRYSSSHHTLYWYSDDKEIIIFVVYMIVVYYEWMNRQWVALGTGTPKDKDEVNRREVFECDDCCLL
jgi:hypothetical protein